jgi:eukaryotic-like serine/threonine-protein kinase
MAPCETMGEEDVTALLRKVAAAPRLAPPLSSGPQRFQLGRRLGAGQFGEVFVARDREHGGAVALKRLRRGDDEWVHRFKSEFRHMADVSHPNVARLYELFEENGSWFLTMELVDGIPFDEYLVCFPEQLESCFSQLAHAIRALHSIGILHRDVKPSNALVEPTGRVVLLDFGLALGLAKPEEQQVAGTPLYMAPEQWVGELGEHTDWYAFGVMLYEALAAAPPFVGRGNALLAAKQRGPAPLPPTPGRETLADLATRLLRPVAAERPRYREIAGALRVPVATEDRADRLPFVGRHVELARLHDVARGRDAAWITLTGEAGMGKTALARVFLETVANGGALVFAGRCHETESTPLQGLDGAVGALSGHLAGRNDSELEALVPLQIDALLEMFPVLKRVGAFRSPLSADRQRVPHARRAAAVGALRDIFAALAVDRRVCLFIDDIQWAGEDTLDLLQGLVSPPLPGLLVVTTMRSAAVSVRAFLERLERLGELSWSSLELSPLDRDDVAALVAGRPELAMDGDVAFRESHGHPYLLSRIVGGSATLTADLMESITALSSEARALLEVISLEAQPLTQAAALGAAGVDGFRADVVDELRRERLARTSRVRPDAVIEPYHDRVRETLLSMLSEEDLRKRHDTLARYLESNRRASPHSLAQHYQEAKSFDNARRWIRLAARDAVRGLAFLRGDELYQAVELSPGAEGIDLRVEWAEAMVLCGRSDHAAQIYLDASDVAEKNGHADEAADLRSSAGEHWILAGRFERGFALIESTLASFDVVLPKENERAVALAMETFGELLGRGLAFEPRPESEIEQKDLSKVDLLLNTARALTLTDLRASYLANLAMLEALRLGEPRRMQRGLTHLIFGSAAAAPELPIFVEAVARAYELAEQQDDDLGRAWVVAADGLRHMHAGDMKRAWPLLRESERRFWALDPPMIREGGGMRALTLACASVDGVDVQFAIRMADTWLADAERRDDYFVSNWMRLVGARVKRIAGDMAGAARQLAESRRTWSEIDDDFFAATLIHCEMVEEVYFKPDDAHVRGQELMKKLSGMFVSSAPIAKAGFHVFYGSALAAAGRAGRLTGDELATRIEGVIAELSVHNYAAPAKHALQANLALFRGDRTAAAEHMARAVEGWAERDQQLYAACARLRHAQLARDAARTEACIRELRAIGVGDPERYATVLSGPAPPP